MEPRPICLVGVVPRSKYVAKPEIARELPQADINPGSRSAILKPQDDDCIALAMLFDTLGRQLSHASAGAGQVGYRDG
jgi:hypothetical protein